MSNAKEVIQDWKQNRGFPYYPEDRKWRDDEFNKLTSFNRDTLLDTKNTYKSADPPGVERVVAQCTSLFQIPFPPSTYSRTTVRP